MKMLKFIKKFSKIKWIKNKKYLIRNKNKFLFGI